MTVRAEQILRETICWKIKVKKMEKFTNETRISLCVEMVLSFVTQLICSHFIGFAEDKDTLRKRISVVSF